MKRDFEKDIRVAHKRVDDIFDDEYKEYYTQFFTSIYPFTTENIDGYIDNFDLKDKSLLTVGSSGDQVLNAILKCSKDITVIDINPFVKYYYYLKVAAIINLNYSEFKYFFRYNNYPDTFDYNDHAFNRDVFEKIKDDLRILDYESYLFWDELLQYYDPLLVREKLFTEDENESKIINTFDTYLKDEDYYNDLKQKIKKVRPKFIYGDIFQMTECLLGRKYDNIWLSNFSSYYQSDEILCLVNKLDEVLNDNGSFLITYMYDIQPDSTYEEDYPDMYNLDKTFNLFSKYNPKLINFLGLNSIIYEDVFINNYRFDDSILVYKKKGAR